MAAGVKELREKTGAGMLDCKKALDEAGGDFEKAVEFLRKKGLAAADKKAGRVAAEGLCYAYVNSTADQGALVEMNCETDFVAKTDQFQTFLKSVTQLAAEKGVKNAEELGALAWNGKTVTECVRDLIASLGENMAIRRVVTYRGGFVGSYIHAGGKIGVMIHLKSDKRDAGVLGELARDLAMHSAAAHPLYLKEADVPSSILDKEKDILRTQVEASGKPAAVIDKIVEGRVQKFYDENCLIRQEFIKDPDKKVSQVVKDVSTKLGSPIEVSGFTRYQVGEGIEKKSTDFAAEVAAVTGKN